MSMSEGKYGTRIIENYYTNTLYKPNNTFYSRLEENIAKSLKGPFSEIMTIAPEDAKKILKNNPNNRVLNHTLIKTIASDIEFGRWRLNGESIIFAKEGELNDGQHRLLACILANQPFQTSVFFGAERDSRLTVDMGKPRSVGNLLSMEGIPNYNHCASIARMYFLYRLGRYQDGGSSEITKQKIRQEYFTYQQEIDDSIKAVGHQKFSSIIGVTSICTSFIAIGDVNATNRDEFFEKLISGENIKSGSPILKAREHLMDMKYKRSSAQQRMEAIFKYWNAWRRGITMSRACSIHNEWPDIEG